MSSFDVVSIGELLIDLVPLPAADDSMRFVAKPGGAPGNVAVGVARLGGRSAMLTKVGDEAFGRMLVDTLRGNGVSIDGIRTTRERRTGLAVVTLTPEGDRDFFFYRDGCADSDLSPDDLDQDILRATKVFHVGSLFLAQPTSASAQRHGMAFAKEKGIRISADPNLRVHLWGDQAAMLAAGREVIQAANILKVSDDELRMLTGIEDIAQAVCALWHPDLQFAAVTKGPKGAELYTANASMAVDGFVVETVDTIGCGDAFMATLLTELVARDFQLEGKPALEQVARRACAAGALTATRTGGMESLPGPEAIDAFLASRA
ncbi:MAG TPA: carbohydrate kinase [Geminicoccus sp.]|jgi:fructokinase|uniref:carbohydrate kinase family protein n=1 Tax=Geminicoccus sp. TaxID=2024832 RepID=UPI002E318D50|nr:carbohydrate kinase [Geminicoccus sp.]HEX2528962.1 carbohydrate kinase [Geminicoccus sp.]